MTQILDVETRQRRGPLFDFGMNRLIGTAFLPSDAGFCSIADNTATIWGLDGQQLHETFVHEGRDRVWTLAISSDGSLLATAMGNWEETSPGEASVAVWSIPTGQQLGKLIDVPLQVGWMQFSPDSRLLATACMDGKVRIHDVHPDPRTPQQIATWVEATTGRRLDQHGEPHFLSNSELRELYRQLEPSTFAETADRVSEGRQSETSPADAAEPQALDSALVAQRLARRGEHERARDMLIKAMKSVETGDAENQIAIADLTFLRAKVEKDASEFDKSADLYEQCLKIVEAIDGKRSARAADVIFSLANLEASSRQNEDRALELFHRWFSITSDLYGDFGATIGVRKYVADIHQRRGEYDSAARLYRDSVDISDKCYSAKFGSNRSGLAEWSAQARPSAVCRRAHARSRASVSRGHGEVRSHLHAPAPPGGRRRIGLGPSAARHRSS